MFRRCLLLSIVSWSDVFQNIEEANGSQLAELLSLAAHLRWSIFLMTRTYLIRWILCPELSVLTARVPHQLSRIGGMVDLQSWGVRNNHSNHSLSVIQLDDCHWTRIRSANPQFVYQAGHKLPLSIRHCCPSHSESHWGVWSKSALMSSLIRILFLPQSISLIINSFSHHLTPYPPVLRAVVRQIVDSSFAVESPFILLNYLNSFEGESASRRTDKPGPRDDREWIDKVGSEGSCLLRSAVDLCEPRRQQKK